jgi:hypothetical protein
MRRTGWSEVPERPREISRALRDLTPYTLMPEDAPLFVMWPNGEAWYIREFGTALFLAQYCFRGSNNLISPVISVNHSKAPPQQSQSICGR